MQFDYQNSGIHLTVPKCCPRSAIQWPLTLISLFSLVKSLATLATKVWQRDFKFFHNGNENQTHTKWGHTQLSPFGGNSWLFWGPHINISKSLTTDRYLSSRTTQTDRTVESIAEDLHCTMLLPSRLCFTRYLLLAVIAHAQHSPPLSRMLVCYGQMIIWWLPLGA